MWIEGSVAGAVKIMAVLIQIQEIQKVTDPMDPEHCPFLNTQRGLDNEWTFYPSPSLASLYSTNLWMTLCNALHIF